MNSKDLNVTSPFFINYPLKVTFFLGWIIGLLPTSSPNFWSKQFRVQKCSIGAILCFALGVLVLILGLDNVISNYTIFVAKQINSQQIINGGQLVAAHSVDIVLRALIVVSVPKIVQFIYTIQELKHFCRVNSRSGHNELKFTLGLLLCIQILSEYTTVVIDYFIEVEWQDQMGSYFFSNVKWLPGVGHFVLDNFRILTKLFPEIVMFTFASWLLILLKEFYKAFEGTFLSDFKKKEESPHFTVQAFDKNYNLIQYAFCLYNQIAGKFCLFSICQSIFWFMDSTFELFVSPSKLGKIQASGTALSNFMVILTVSHLGELMARHVKSETERLEKTFRAYQLKHKEYSDRNVKIIAEAMVSWKWKLTANNFFVINYRLLPAIAGTMMTFSIFMFQLKLTEPSS